MNQKLFKNRSLIVIIFSASLILTMIGIKLLTPLPIDISDNLNSKCENREKCVAELQKNVLGNIASSTQKSINNAESFINIVKIPYSILSFEVSIRNSGSYVGYKLKDSPDWVGKIFYPTLECYFAKEKYRIEPYQRQYIKSGFKYNPAEISELIQSYQGCSVLMQLGELSATEVPIDYHGTIFQVWQRKPYIEFGHSYGNYLIIYMASLSAILLLLGLVKQLIYWDKNSWSGFGSS